MWSKVKYCPWQWVHGSLWAWYCSEVCWWNFSLTVSMVFYLWCWLPWEVHINPEGLISINQLSRVLLATIKSLRWCPCPRCHVLKDQMSDLSTVNDMKHQENIHEDNVEQQDKVEKACHGIFTKGYSIVSTAFQNIMGLTSLVPTWASHFFRLMWLYWLFSECLFQATLKIWVQLSFYARSRSTTVIYRSSIHTNKDRPRTNVWKQ